MKFLSDPTRLKPVDKKTELLQVIVETPAGSRNKFAFDPKQGIFALKKVLPAGMVSPYDFGFLPHTIAPDGDPIDVLLLMDEPAFPGCAVRSRLIGVIEGEQIDGKKRIRNDRLIAVAEANHMYANVENLQGRPGEWLEGYLAHTRRASGLLSDIIPRNDAKLSCEETISNTGKNHSTVRHGVAGRSLQYVRRFLFESAGCARPNEQFSKREER